MKKGEKMTNLDRMQSALKKYVFSKLVEKGYVGKYPHFMKRCENYIELISFVTNKYGGSFYIETSVAFPQSKNKNYYLVNNETENDLTVFNTNIRYRLKGMFDGQFYYSDVYKGHYKFRAFKKSIIYESVLCREKAEPYIKMGYKCVQYFNENTAVEICKKINSQLEKAYKWMEKFEKKNR